MNRFAPHAFALLRVFAGVMFMMHGTQKILGWPGTRPPATAPLSITAGWIEMTCGALIAIGLLAGWAAFLASGTMAVAYWMRHGPDALWPLENRGELAVLYCFLFLWIAAHGAGAWSIDALIKHRQTAG
jgi:putative oxidoreductase